jgi:hypothetical protein
MNYASQDSSEGTVMQLARPRRRRWVSLLLALVILICGIAIGAAGTIHVLHRHLQYAIHHPEGVPAHLASRLRSNLDLSAEQTSRVEGIVRVRQEQIQQIRLRFQPEFEAQLDGIEKDIAGVLTARQAAQWHDWVAEKRRLWLPPLPKTTAPSQP